MRSSSRFGEPDAQSLTLPLTGISLGPMVVWGWVLVVGAWRCCSSAATCSARTIALSFEASMLVSFGFFILATRMHDATCSAPSC